MELNNYLHYIMIQFVDKCQAEERVILQVTLLITSSYSVITGTGNFALLSE